MMDNFAEKIVSRLMPLNPVKIILFGSYANGKPDENSDLDLCIVKQEVKSRISEKRRIRKLLHDISIAKDILVPSLKEYDFYKKEPGSIYMDIDQKGIVLWQVS
jgi:uncharacterized protein